MIIRHPQPGRTLWFFPHTHISWIILVWSALGIAQACHGAYSLLSGEFLCSSNPWLMIFSPQPRWRVFIPGPRLMVFSPKPRLIHLSDRQYLAQYLSVRGSHSVRHCYILCGITLQTLAPHPPLQTNEMWSDSVPMSELSYSTNHACGTYIMLSVHPLH